MAAAATENAAARAIIIEQLQLQTRKENLLQLVPVVRTLYIIYYIIMYLQHGHCTSVWRRETDNIMMHTVPRLARAFEEVLTGSPECQRGRSREAAARCATAHPTCATC